MVLISGLKLWIIFIINEQLSAVSYNQPKFCPDASWNPDAVTFASISAVGSSPIGIFVNVNNTIYVADRANNRIQMWFNNSANPTRTISGGLSNSYSLFVTTNGDIYVDNGFANGRVDKWPLNANTSVPVMYVNAICYGIFVDINDTLYCSMDSLHQVVKRCLNDNTSTSTTSAGTGTAGSTATMLYGPQGIFVDVNFDLYVADCANHRIQLFQFGQLNATTVAGTTSSTTTIALNRPSGIVLDADNYLFIVDNNNHRIVGSGPNGFRCVVGCSNSTGSASNQLNYPRTLNFDSYGNMFITDQNNNRIQKFLLSTNSCDERTTQQTIFTSTMIEVESSANTIESTVSTVFHQKETTHETSTMMDTGDFPSISSTDQSKTTELPLSSSFFVSSCRGQYQIGLHCNISSAPCDILQPCQNNSTCVNNNSIPDSYVCLCSQGFNGTTCQVDNRSCKPNTCWNNGTCNETLNRTFECLCQPGWTGIQCEAKINYCKNVTCLNNGVCRPILLNYTCECLGTSFSGQHCEIITKTMVIRQMASKSFGYISILFIGSIVMFFIIMDVLKYYLGIDPAKDELEKIRRIKRAKKAKPPPVIQKFVYVNAPPPKTTITETNI